ncbi:hypothetical protein GOBAR_AA10449 [Gossypium barbadense]|uniref:Uncharacterized protein n=1 Tax=Gossypium barbadense TaxID=3634 RepID=A0A2P5Y3L5_GOSBA|nr:hypothetical protein GOBAR_AA10449 [Gossypium barbadense]
MKSSHELDERVVVAESVGPRAMGEIIRSVLVGLLLDRLGEMILWRVGSSAPLDHPHAKHARDVLDGGRTDALEQLGWYEAILGAKVCQHFEGEKCMWRLRACSSFSSRNSSVYRPRAALNSGMLSWRVNPPRRNWTVPGSSYLLITVWGWNVEHSSIVSSRETVGEGDRFLRLGLPKKTLPSSSSKQVR